MMFKQSDDHLGVFPLTSQYVQETGISVGGCLLQDLAKTHGTPLFVMDEASIRFQCRLYTETLKKEYPNSLVCFAGKANLNVGLLNLLADEGLGVDVVSGGEIYTALKSAVLPENMIVHGNNKSKEELLLAIQNQLRIVLDNQHEIEMVKQLAMENGKQARVMIRIKPEIDAHTHDYIKTGKIDSKFGLDQKDLVSLVSDLVNNPHIDFLGIHSHIGSQIFDVDPYEELVLKMVGHMVTLKTSLGLELKELNLGGGFGIQYVFSDDPPSVPEFLTRITSALKSQCQEAGLSLPRLLFEPGRSIVGSSGLTLYRVGSVKSIPGIKDYIFVDGGMADNPRPILYQSEYTFHLAHNVHEKELFPYTIAGKFCESGDVLAHDVMLPKVNAGDILVVYGTGAYNYSMASNYNRFCKPAMVSVHDGQVTPLVKRETYEDILRFDVF